MGRSLPEAKSRVSSGPQQGKPRTSSIRTRINHYTYSAILAVSSFVFLNLVNFLPAAPAFPLLVAIGLTIFSLRRAKAALSVLYSLVILSIVYQWVGFGLIPLVSSGEGLAVVALSIFLLMTNYSNLKIESTSMALAILSVGLMVTPVFYLSVPLVVVAAIVGGVASISAISTTFVFTLLPMLEIDNALYFIRVGTSNTPPVLFAQLSDLAQNMRPPLSGLNVALTGLPPGIVYPQANQVATILLGGIPTLAVPIILFSLAFGFSASIAGIVITVLRRLTAFGKLQDVLRKTSPLVTAVTTPVAFIFLITFLSPKNIGGYTTGFAQDPNLTLNIVLSSILLGALFTGREYVVSLLEEKEFAKSELVPLLAEARMAMEEVLRTIDKVSVGVPSLELGDERRTINEYASHMTDVEKGMNTAPTKTLQGWVAEIREKIIPALRRTMPEVLRLKVSNEVNTLIALAATYNASLEEAGLDLRFPEPAGLSGKGGIDEAIQTYKSLSNDIAVSGEEVFKRYAGTLNASNALLGREKSEPPLDPAALFTSHDYATAMKLLAEEYWLNFHIGTQDEFLNKLKDLTAAEKQLEPILRPAEVAGLRKTMGVLENVSPVDSPSVVERMNELISLLATLASNAKSEVEDLGRMIRDLTPASTRAVQFEALGQLGMVTNLQQEFGHVAPSFGEVTNLIMSTLPILEAQRESQRRDESKMIIISHYPAAKRLLSSMLEKKKIILISELPFQREPASTFAKIYAISNRDVKYDEINEQMVVKNA